MQITKEQLQQHNEPQLKKHQAQWTALRQQLEERGVDVASTLQQLRQFQVAIPSWALGTGGTRFGRFPIGGAPLNLEEKMMDIGMLHALNRSSGAISLHIPWDIPDNAAHIRALATELDLRFDAVNSNTFQDQPDQQRSYRFGSLCHTDKEVRRQAVEHNLEVVRYGAELGTNVLSVWLSDGSNFPGQYHMQGALQRTLESLQSIYAGMPDDFLLFLEYKPFEPAFYATVIPDWGTSFLLVNKLGDRARTLVDLGHHLPNTNIEQIVSTLLAEDRLAGFHFNDSKFADDDLTTGSIKPYQLFLIFYELVDGMRRKQRPMQDLGWMIDASHNIKDPLEDLLQSVDAILLAYAQALIVDTPGLQQAQEENDPVLAQEALQDAFRTDLRPLLAEARLQDGAALSPIHCYRELQVRKNLIAARGEKTIATGL
ncbi:sugar isomerase [Compostibacter hankyongensis]|uniref:L-rhamnose catabolism isomerase n=1 Tax=Compostibacter hankyongensis TaxID=1007089 RepID=A0ABP8FFL0_9BACT